MATTTPQARCALDRANTVRFAAAAVKRELREGAIELADALEDPRAARMTLGVLLSTIRRVGVHRAELAAVEAGTTSLRRCGDLTDRQRAIIVRRLSR